MIRLVQAARVDEIREWQYERGQTVKFSYFDSCIGVLGKINYWGREEVIGVHLAIKDKGGANVTEQDVGQIKWLLERYGYVRGSAKVIGQISIWEVNNAKALQRLYRDLEIVGEDRVYRLGQGRYGGQLDEGEVSVT